MGEISGDLTTDAAFLCKNCTPKTKPTRKSKPLSGRRELDFSEYAPDASPDEICAMEASPEEQRTIYTSKERAEARGYQQYRDLSINRVTSQDIADTASILESMIPDAEEREVVYAKMRGFKRELYLAQATDENDRRRRQAAWKRHQRHGIPSGLREALKRAAQNRIEQPEWEERRENDEKEEWKFDRSSGLGGGRRTPSRKVGDKD
jgi:hypothetical protein